MKSQFELCVIENVKFKRQNLNISQKELAYLYFTRGKLVTSVYQRIEISG